MARLQALGDIEAAVWQELTHAIRNRGHAWRVGVLATVDGDTADARNIVLRDVDPAARTLLTYTDARSPKTQQLALHPGGTLVLWSAALGWQLRLRVQLALATSGPLVAARWAQLEATPAAQDYLSPLAPGSVIGAPVAPRVPDLVPPSAPERQSRAHFAVLAARVLSMDWLELHAEGHRRARFDAAGAAWLTP